MIDDEEVAVLDAALRGMFKALETRVLPDRILSVLDQLDDGEAAEAPPARLRA